MPEPAITYLAVTRRNYVVRHFELSRPAHELLGALLAGKAMGEAIQCAVETADSETDHLANNLHTWFTDWAAEGFFSAIEVPEQPTGLTQLRNLWEAERPSVRSIDLRPCISEPDA